MSIWEEKKRRPDVENSNVRVVRGVKLESGVEKPPKGVVNKYPLEEMEVGESFAITDINSNRITTLMRAVKKTWPNRTYDARKMRDGSYRIWRDA